MTLNDHKPRPKFLEHRTPAWVNVLIAAGSGIVIGTVLGWFI
jgi:hypothetical protein